MQTLSRNTPFLWFCYVHLPLLVALLVPASVFAQDQGDVMQIFRQAEKQVRKLNKSRSLTQHQALATKRAIEDFSKATSAEGVEQATEQCLTEFRKSEKALENLSLILRGLSDSLEGLKSLKDSVEGERQLGELSNSINNVNQALSPLTKSDGIQVEAQFARATTQQMNLVQNEMKNRRQQAAEHQKKADQSRSNLERLSAILARSSVLVDLVKLKNGFNRELVGAIAMHKAPTHEKREALENLMGEFGTPSNMVDQINDLADSMTEATATLIMDMFKMGTGVFPDFSDEDVDAAVAAMNRVREDTCEECTDGMDNDLDGKIDALQSETCRLFVEHDPDCATSNASL